MEPLFNKLRRLTDVSIKFFFFSVTLNPLGKCLVLMQIKDRGVRAIGKCDFSNAGNHKLLAYSL